MSSRSMIKQLYSLRVRELDKLLSRYSADTLLKERANFIVGEYSRPVNVFLMFYYIDIHGDFINNGKEIHHHIARAIYNSMPNSRKVEIMQYIEDVREEEEDET